MAKAKSKSGSRVKHMNKGQFGKKKKSTGGLSWFYAYIFGC